MNLVCLICTDDIRSDCSAPKCGHIFHSECLKHWLQLNKTCPQCRAKCSKVGDVIKLFLNAEAENDICCEDASPSADNDCSPRKLRSRISEVERVLSEKEADLEILRGEYLHCKDENGSLKVSKSKYEKKYNEEHKIVSQLNREIKSVYAQFDKLTEEHSLTFTRNEELESAAKVYRLIQSALENGKTEIEFLVASYGNGPTAVKSIAQSLFHLKKNYDELKEVNESIRSEKEKYSQEMKELQRKYSRKSQELQQTNSKVSYCKAEYYNLKQKFQKLKLSLHNDAEDENIITISPKREIFRSQAKRPKISPESSPDPLEKSTMIPFTDKESPNVMIISCQEAKPSGLIQTHKAGLPINLRPNYRKCSLVNTAPYEYSIKRKLTQKASFHTFGLKN